MIEIQLRNSANTILGPGPLGTITRWRQIRRLDQAGEIQFELPASDLRAHESQGDGNPLLHPKRYAYAYGLQNGVMTNVGAGIVEEAEISLSGRGVPMHRVSGGDLLSELTRVTCWVSNEPDYGFQITGSTGAPTTILGTFALSHTLPGSWSLSGSATAMEFYGRFIHESVLGALRSVAQATGEHFRLGSGRQIVWLGAAASFADCGVRAETDVDPIAAEGNDDICLITNITRRKEAWNLCNVVFPSGAGQGADAITLEFMTEWPDGHPFVSDISTIVGAAGTVTVTTATAHGLTTLDDPTIEGTVNFDGTASNVTVTGTTTFTYSSGTTASESNVGVVIGPTSRTIGGYFYIIDRGSNRLTNYTNQLVYGHHGKAITFRNIASLSNGGADLAAAANALGRAAYNWMLQHAEPARFYDLSVAKLTQTVYPGQTMRVVCRQFISEADDATGAETTGVWLDINEDLYILEVVEEHTQSGTEVVGLTVATVDRWPEDGVSTVLDSVQTLVDATTHPQPSESVDTVSREQPIDADNDFSTRFRLPNYVQRVHGAVLWFRVDQLTSPVRSVGGTSTSTGASSASSSASEGAHTHTTPSHYHNTTVVDGSAFSLVGNANLYTSGGIYYIGHDAGSSSHPVTTVTTGEGGTTSAAGASHTHDIPHTHNVTGSITTLFGVFRESLTNTYTYTGIGITINGATPTNSVVVEGSGWYSLDLLVDVASSFNGVPLQTFNEVIFSDGLATVNISSISGSGSVVTVATSSAHGLSTGHNVKIAGTTYHNGIWTSITVTGGSGFTYVSTTTNSESTGTIQQYKTANIYAEFEIRSVLQSLG